MVIEESKSEFTKMAKKDTKLNPKHLSRFFRIKDKESRSAFLDKLV